MPKWISIDRAIHKYEVKEEDLKRKQSLHLLQRQLLSLTKRAFRNSCAGTRLFARKITFIHWNNSVTIRLKSVNFI